MDRRRFELADLERQLAEAREEAESDRLVQRHGHYWDERIKRLELAIAELRMRTVDALRGAGQ